MSSPIESWVSEILGLPVDSVVHVQEEQHCPDPTCPLRHTVLQWNDREGKPHRAVIVKPLDYVRRPDVEQALRLFAVKR
jgi:hypothetical protein